jgi:hypothetical protein
VIEVWTDLTSIEVWSDFDLPMGRVSDILWPLLGKTVEPYVKAAMIRLSREVKTKIEVWQEVLSQPLPNW